MSAALHRGSLLGTVHTSKDTCAMRIEIPGTNKRCVYDSALLLSNVSGFLTEISTAGRTSVVR